MQTTDLFGQPVVVEGGKGGKPRLVFGESAPPGKGSGTPAVPVPRQPDAPRPPATGSPAPAPPRAGGAAVGRSAPTPKLSPADRLQRARVLVLVLAQMQALAEAEVTACQEQVGLLVPDPPVLADGLLARVARTGLEQPWLKAQVAFLTRHAGCAAGGARTPAPGEGSETGVTTDVVATGADHGAADEAAAGGVEG